MHVPPTDQCFYLPTLSLAGSKPRNYDNTRLNICCNSSSSSSSNDCSMLDCSMLDCSIVSSSTCFTQLAGRSCRHSVAGVQECRSAGVQECRSAVLCRSVGLQPQVQRLQQLPCACSFRGHGARAECNSVASCRCSLGRGCGGEGGKRRLAWGQNRRTKKKIRRNLTMKYNCTHPVWPAQSCDVIIAWDWSASETRRSKGRRRRDQTLEYKEESKILRKMKQRKMS